MIWYNAFICCLKAFWTKSYKWRPTSTGSGLVSDQSALFVQLLSAFVQSTRLLPSFSAHALLWSLDKRTGRLQNATTVKVGFKLMKYQPFSK